jgi:glycosyl-4,4'-diaponeurosporenoate acyltransferase
VKASLVTVGLDALAWALWGTAVGYGAHRLPRASLADDNVLTRLHPWERDGRVYERLRIRRWKRVLPDAGAVFRGGVAKRDLVARDPASLRTLVEETRRAELVHWAVAGLAPVFALWNPAPLAVAMVAYAVAANAPCIVVQRYNRSRLLRVLAHSGHREKESVG